MKGRSSSSKNKNSAKQKKNGKRASPDPNRAMLLDAIRTANLERVRMVLEEICTTSTEAYEIACSKLLVELVDDTSSDPSLDSESEESELRNESEPAATSATKKRKSLSQRYETCEQCEEEYDVGENDSDACTFHPDELEYDSDAEFWHDYDARCHGLRGAEENKKEHPEAFIYGCCQGDGDASGCETDVHRPMERKRRKH